MGCPKRKKKIEFFPPLLKPGELNNGKRFNVLDGVVFSPNGQKLACLFQKRSEVPVEKPGAIIRVWDVSSGKELATLEEKDGTGQLGFSPEGKLEILRDGAFLWDVATNNVVKRLVVGGEKVIGRRVNSILVQSPDGILKVMDLVTATLVTEQKDLPKNEKHNWIWVSDRFLLSVEVESWHGFFFDFFTGEKHRKIFEDNPLLGMIHSFDITTDGETIAFEDYRISRNPWWLGLLEWIGIQESSSEDLVTLQAFPSGDEICVLKGCKRPLFSPDSRTLAVTSNNGSLQLWDLPIRKPIGKILGLPILAAVTTLLAINGLGWLQRRRTRLKASVVPNSVPATK